MRKDIEIQHDVMDELQYEPSVDASEIGVSCKDGIVTLTGTVKTYTEKELAGLRVERIPGVRALVDEMKVELPQLHERTDQDIAAAALRGLEWNGQVPHTRIRVKVEKGIITLEGDVDYRYQEVAARSAVRDLMGVKGVVSLISVKPIVTPLQLKEKIESAFRRVAELSAKDIKVEVHHDQVILRGNVSSWSARAEAECAAWSAPGVRTVEDHLIVTR